MHHALTFPMAEVLRLAKHAIDSPQQSYGYDVLFEDKHHLGGVVKKNAEDWPDKDNIDKSTITPNLQLVKDQGVYLMSSGQPALPVGENVVYAQECDPTKMTFDEWYPAGREIMGGDDSVTTFFDLPQQVVEAAEKGAVAMVIHVTKVRFAIEFAFPPAQRSRPRPTMH